MMNWSVWAGARLAGGLPAPQPAILTATEDGEPIVIEEWVRMLCASCETKKRSKG